MSSLEDIEGRIANGWMDMGDYQGPCWSKSQGSKWINNIQKVHNIKMVWKNNFAKSKFILVRMTLEIFLHEFEML